MPLAGITRKQWSVDIGSNNLTDWIYYTQAKASLGGARKQPSVIVKNGF
jgi:hypothetical protein